MLIRDVYRSGDEGTAHFRGRAHVARRWAERAVEPRVVDFYRGLAAFYEEIADGDAGIPPLIAHQVAKRTFDE